MKPPNSSEGVNLIVYNFLGNPQVVPASERGPTLSLVLSVMKMTTMMKTMTMMMMMMMMTGGKYETGRHKKRILLL